MPERERPILIYDGDCQFCRRWTARWRRMTGDRVDYAPYQEVADGFPDITRDRFDASVQFVDKDETVYTGAEAVFRALAHAPGMGWTLAAYRSVPGFAVTAERVYRFVARRRGSRTG
ncbi:MAG: DUF393 domain-containing protein [Nitrospinae bacterium]|nr:DUF393 domain-containing protein [Nitrospinota bacterium]